MKSSASQATACAFLGRRILPLMTKALRKLQLCWSVQTWLSWDSAGHHFGSSARRSMAAVLSSKLMGLIPKSQPQVSMMLEKSGFGDARYLVTENTIASCTSHNHMEIAFNGP